MSSIDNMAKAYLDSTSFDWLMPELEEFWKDSIKPPTRKELYSRIGGLIGNILFAFLVASTIGVFIIDPYFPEFGVPWLALRIGLGFLCAAIGSYLGANFFYLKDRTERILRSSKRTSTQVGKMRGQFLIDPIFRMDEMHKFLSECKIPALRIKFENAKADVSSALHSLRFELENDLSKIERIIQEDRFLNTSQKKAVEETRDNIASQLSAIRAPEELIAVRDQTEAQMQIAEQVSRELSKMVNDLRSVSEADPLIQKYAGGSYESVNDTATRLFEGQINKLREIGSEVSKVNNVGIDMVDNAKQLNSGQSPMDKLIADKSTA
ncbi:hypothetical protein IPM19_01325 [bacterium]|nr:MAG: hypothetical protein IPM19_01325 [bacterium]